VLTSWQCQQCGLANLAYDANCQRCGTVNPRTAAQAGVVLADGYVMPPPPGAGGVWRDGKTMVMAKGAYLPDRCVKCNAPANGLRLKRKLSWHHPLLYLLAFGAMLFYLILAMALSKRVTVDFGICAEHLRRRRTLMAIGLGLLVAGILIPIVAFTYDYAGLGLLGILLAIFSVVWLILANRIVTVKKIDDYYLWLTGVNEQFLALFPTLPPGHA
jgi:hypothetical protein